MNLFVSNLAYFIEDCFFPNQFNFIDFGARSSQATLAVLTQPGMTTMFSSRLFLGPVYNKGYAFIWYQLTTKAL